MESICRICGHESNEYFWDDGCPAYIICPCCGCESGNEDYTVESAKEYRTEWVDNGAKWFDEKLKPIEWILSTQLEKIPEDYK
ncbi:hypothetical protein JSO59_002475 [Riemerella anatipestifer]|uniref:hypothetical protein n=1 Tax=Riemerella anatipestifer TaxID=34085 RepID=UPI0030ECC812